MAQTLKQLHIRHKRVARALQRYVHVTYGYNTAGHWHAGNIEIMDTPFRQALVKIERRIEHEAQTIVGRSIR